MTADTFREIEQFLYREARLLDERRFAEWLELLAEDIHYWMPVRANRYAANSKSIEHAPGYPGNDDDIAGPGELAFFDETKESLVQRVERLKTGMAWAEDPPSRTRHVISNIELADTATKDLREVFSNFIVYKNRGETEQEFYVGRREDTLRKEGGCWKISRRKIVLDQNVLISPNLSILF
jgi:3-phenylpropionate/cinnamic acid dioxygenase small subunit